MTTSSGALPTSSRILLSLCFVSYATSFAFPLMSTILITRTGLSSSAVGWLMCVAFLMSAALQPMIGALLDEGRDRLVLGIAGGGVLLGILGMYISARATSALIPALVVFITAFSSISTAASRILEGAATDATRGKVALILMGTVNFGFAVSSALAFFFLQTHQSLLLVLDAISTLLFIATLYVYRPPPKLAEASAMPRAGEGSGLDFRLRGLAIAGTLLIFISTAACLSAIPLLYAKQAQFGNQMSPIMFGICNVVVAVAGIGLASVINEIMLVRQIVCSALLFSIGHSLLPWVDSHLKNVLVTVIWSAGEVFAYSITSRLIFASYSAAEAGKAAGVKSSLMRLAMAATPALAALTVNSDPRLFSAVFGGIPLAGGGLLFAASFRQERKSTTDRPLLSLQAWIQAQFQRSVLLFLSIALALIFSVGSFLSLRERLGQLDDAGESFISSQLPNLQIYDFSRTNSDLGIFARNKPLTAAKMLDANGVIIGRWSNRSEDESRKPAWTVRLVERTSRSIDYRFDGGLGRLLIRTVARERSGAPLGALEVTVSCFLLLKNMLLSAGAFVVVMALTYIFGLRLARLSAKTASGPLEALSKGLQNADQPGHLADLRIATEIAEAEQLIQLFRSLGRRLQEEERRRADAERREAIGAIASQVAHDVRSPLAALDSVMKDLSGLTEDKRSIIRSAVSRIRDIANDLIEKNRDVTLTVGRSIPEIIGSVSDQASVHLVSSHTDPLISEKRLQFRPRMGIEIDSRLDASSYGLFARIQPAVFKRALSNIVNNSVEAIGKEGRVSVELSGEADRVVLRVRDDGKGIPPEVLLRLGRRGETYGKAGGSGLGLYHARTSVEAWGGALEIQSAAGQGTVVTIRLPRAPAPAWFVSELDLQPGNAVVILDDDTSIHQVWRGRFASLRLKEQGIEAVHFSAPDELRGWVRENPAAAGKAAYLIDYELLGSSETGLNLTEKLGFGRRAVLVTSRFEEQAVLDDCMRLGVRMIPKSMAGFVPIRTGRSGEHCDAVLIDDDQLVRVVWKTAAKAHGKALKAFASPREFDASAGGLARTTPIYLDVNLADGARGENFARELSARGFERIILCTGHSPDSFPKMPWISFIGGKEPPWGSEGEREG